MPGAVADETILRLKADIDNFMSDMRKAQKAKDDFNKPTAGGIGKSTSQQFNQIERYASVMGDQISATKQKIQLFQSSIKNLTDVGDKQSMKLAGVFKNNMGLMQKELQSLQSKQPMFTQLTEGLKSMGGPAGQVGNMLETVSSGAAGLAGTLSIVGVALTVVKAGFDAMILPGIKFNMMLEQQTVAFEVMLKSGDAATQMVADLKKLTMSTGVSLADSMASVKQMLAYGFGGEEMISSLKMLNTVAKAVNVPMTDLTYVYGTLRAQGRAYTRDIMQFAMRGIPIYEYLAKVLDVDVSKLKGLVEEGKVGFPEVEKAFQMMTGAGGKFEGMLEKSMNTTAGLVTQIQNQWQLVTGGMAEASGGPVKVILQSLLEILKHSKLIQLIIAALYYPLMAVVAALAFMLAMINDVWHFYVRIFETVASGIKAVFDWIASTDLVRSIIFDITMAIKAAVGWIAQFNNKLADTGVSAKNIAESIRKWFNGEEKKPFIIDTREIEIAHGGKDTLNRILAEMSKGSNVDNTIFADIVSNQWAKAAAKMKGDENLQSIVRGTQATWEDVATVMAKSAKLSEDNLKSFVAAMKSSSLEGLSYWNYFKSQVNKMAGFFGNLENAVFGEGFGQGEVAASVAVDSYKANLLSLQKAYKDIGASQLAQGEVTKEWKEASIKELEMYVKNVLSSNTQLTDSEYGMLRGIQAYINQLKSELQTGTKTVSKAVDDLIQKYLEFRATVTTNETGFSGSLLDQLSQRLGTDITRNLSTLDKKLGLIAQEAEKTRAALREIGAEDKIPLVDEMQRLNSEILRVTMGLKKLQDEANVSTSGDFITKSIYKQYDAQVRLNRLQLDADEARLANAEALYKRNADLVDMYKGGKAQDLADKMGNAMIVSGIEKLRGITGGASASTGPTAMSPITTAIMEGMTPPVDAFGVAVKEFAKGVKAFLNPKGDGNPTGDESPVVTAISAGLVVPTESFVVAVQEFQMGVNTFLKASPTSTQEPLGLPSGAPSTGLSSARTNTYYNPRTLGDESAVTFTTKSLAQIGGAFTPPINKMENVLGQYSGSFATALKGVGDTIAKNIKAFGNSTSQASFGPWMDKLSGTIGIVAGEITKQAGGTELGKTMTSLVTGVGDPITMLIETLVKVILSIENVGRVMAPFTTIAGGMLSMLQGPPDENGGATGPANKALQLTVNMLLKLGEVLGAILIPIFELVGDQLNTLAAPIIILAELLKRFFLAAKPLIKLIMYIINPLFLFGALLGDLMKSMTAGITTEEDRQKELEDLYNKELATLQNLYEVGALSGEEYQLRLAELKRQYGKDTPATDAGISVFQGIFDAITEMGVALNEMMIAFQPVLDFILAVLKPFIVFVFQFIGGFFTDIAHIVTYFANFVSALLAGDWGAVWTSLGGMLKSIAGFFLNPLIRALNFLISGINQLILGTDKDIPLVPELAIGSGAIPSDMMAYLHQGESVVPASFMDSIRKGDLALTGGNGSSGGGGVNIYINVEGSVQTERDLARSIATEVNYLVKKGHV
jgi:hypothetical protein